MNERKVPIQVCIGTYGDVEHWGTLAHRALASVERQTVRPVATHWIHGDSLSDARNRAGLGMSVGAEWLCFLDADDELDPGYLEAMWAVASTCDGPALVQPSTLGVYPDGRVDPEPVLIQPKPLLQGNYMVIGTLIRQRQFAALGGFGDWDLYEDWELWIRAWKAGARLLSCPEAIYRVSVNANGRNSPSLAAQRAAYHAIRRLHQ